MNREEAEEYAKNMSYRDAVYNALQGKSIPYRKATIIKLNELVNRLEPKNIPDIKLTPCAIVKRKVVTFYCRDCLFFGKEFCKQYQIEVSENDGCTTYEMKRGYDDGE